MENKFKAVSVQEYMDNVEKGNLKLGDRFIMKIAPEYAKVLAELYNMVNREIKWSRVRKYANQMRSGQWVPQVLLEGAIYYVDVNGQFISAQHRIMGAIEADYTIEEAIFVVVDRQAFYEFSGEKRTKKDKALMTLKVIDRDTAPEISEALLYLVGQKASLQDARTPCFTKTPSQWSTTDLEALHKEYSEVLQSVINLCGDNKIVRNLFSVLACYLYIGMINEETAAHLLVNKHLLRPKGGSGYLTQALAVLDYLGIENRYNPNKAGPSLLTKGINLIHNPEEKK
ncbi:MAG: hypothetical protein ACRDCE_19780 [Cetobacterium sp.]|uniref:hypothetical protein n=1 Tax=Cetobacterium sp. TaxID=2071632 RepID=UPI003EE43B8B